MIVTVTAMLQVVVVPIQRQQQQRFMIRTVSLLSSSHHPDHHFTKTITPTVRRPTRRTLLQQQSSSVSTEYTTVASSAATESSYLSSKSYSAATATATAAAATRSERHLVIVESPAKCATIEKILNDNDALIQKNIYYTVTSCMGHIRNLPHSHDPIIRKKRKGGTTIDVPTTADDNMMTTAAAETSAVSKFPYRIAGIDLESGRYQPSYVIDEKKRKVVRELQQQVLQADHVLLATDPDREGEAMAWHLADVLQLSPATEYKMPLVIEEGNPKKATRKKKTANTVQNKPYHRIRFTEITKQAILSAVQSTYDTPSSNMKTTTSVNDESSNHLIMSTNTTIDDNLVAAQETRRVLDRLAGYTVSPILWKKIAPGLSAGRVQSVGLQLIVVREKQRLSFETTPYYDLSALLHPKLNTTMNPSSKSTKSKLVGRIISINGTTVATSGKDFATQGRTLTETAKHKYHLASESVAQYWVDQMISSTSEWTVHTIKSTKRVYKPPLPYKTSTLQQEAARRLGLPVQQTMRAAQQLYEAGCISYMRTDSTILSKDAEGAVEDAIRTQFGPEYIERFVPRTLVGGKKKDKFAQEAHEAIRPAIQEDGKFYTPEEIPSTLQGPAVELYRMIYQRTQAYRMPPLITNQTQVMIRGVKGETELLFRTSGRVVLSPGYTLAYQIDDNNDDETENDDDITKQSTQILPALVEGQVLELDELNTLRHDTQPPSRYTEASFVKELEALGVGRPSTYAGIVQTLRDRAYIGNPISANDDGSGSRRGGKTWTGSAISAMRAAGGQEFVGSGSARGPLVPSLSAFVVCSLLETHCPTYVDPHFTARMEDRLDEIASGDGDNSALSGEEQRIKYLNEFYAGENGLAAQIKRIEENVDASIARRAILPALAANDESLDDSDDQVGLYIGPWGPYVQKISTDIDSDTGEKLPSTSLPPSMAADISTIKLSTLKTLLSTKQEGGTLLGQHPVDGRSIRIKTGRYGVYLQWGDDKEEGTTSHTLPRKRVHMRHVETLSDEVENDSDESSLGSLFRISLEEAVAYCSLPRVVSTIADKPITAAFGPYGPYLKYDSKFLRLKPSDGEVFTVDSETADQLVKDGIIDASSKISKSVIAIVGEMFGGNVCIRKRRYGYFVEWKCKSTKLPMEYVENPKDVTLEQAWSSLDADHRKKLQTDVNEMEADPASEAIHKHVVKMRTGKDVDTKSHDRKKKSVSNAKMSGDDRELPARPKRPITSYLHFCAAQRPGVAESVKSLGDISKKLASLWAETSDEDREVYVTLAVESKLQYEEQLRAWQEQFDALQNNEGHALPSSKSKSSSVNGLNPSQPSSSSSVARVPSASILPARPKRPLTSYLHFCAAQRPAIAESGKSLGDISKKLASLWAKTSDEDREVYVTLAVESKLQYEEQLRAWQEQSGALQNNVSHSLTSSNSKPSSVNGSKSSQSSSFISVTRVLPTRPKRPITSYLHFCAAQRPAVAESVKSLGDISKKLASLWAETSDEDREMYVKLSTESKLQYEEQLRAWQEEFGALPKNEGRAPKSSKSKSSTASESKTSQPSDLASPSVPRAPSAYMLFCRDERPGIVDAVSGTKLPFVETTQRLAALWRECDVSIKDKYQQMATIEKSKLQQSADQEE